jgi:hypothetical protein
MIKKYLVILVFCLMQLSSYGEQKVYDFSKGSGEPLSGKSNAAKMIYYLKKGNKPIKGQNISFATDASNPIKVYFKDKNLVTDEKGMIETEFWSDDVGSTKIYVKINEKLFTNKTFLATFKSEKFDLVASNYYFSYLNSSQLDRGNVVQFLATDYSGAQLGRFYVAVDTFDDGNQYRNTDLDIDWDAPKDMTEAIAESGKKITYPIVLVTNFNKLDRKRRDALFEVRLPQGERITTRNVPIRFSFTARVSQYFQTSQRSQGLKSFLGLATRIISQDSQNDLLQEYHDFKSPYLEFINPKVKKESIENYTYALENNLLTPQGAETERHTHYPDISKIINFAKNYSPPSTINAYTVSGYRCPIGNWKTPGSAVDSNHTSIKSIDYLVVRKDEDRLSLISKKYADLAKDLLSKKGEDLAQILVRSSFKNSSGVSKYVDIKLREIGDTDGRFSWEEVHVDTY